MTRHLPLLAAAVLYAIPTVTIVVAPSQPDRAASVERAW